MNKDIDKKLDQLLADMPKPEYDLDAWLAENETAVFDRLQRMNTDFSSQRMNTDLHGSKRKVWRWIAAAACLIIVIGIGVTLKQISITEPEPMLAENNAQPLPSLVGEGQGVGSVTTTPHSEVQTTHQKELQTPPQTPPLEGRGAAARSESMKKGRGAAARPESMKKGRGAAARTIAKNSLPDTLGTGIWQRRENVVRAVQILSDCEADIHQEEQEIRNHIIEATFRATPQPKNAILVTTETGNLEVIETRNIIEI